MDEGKSGCAVATKPLVLQGVEVDESRQPLKAWGWPVDLQNDYERGAHQAYHGLSKLTGKHSDEYKKGRNAQIKLLPKRPGTTRAIAWTRCLYRKGLNGWVLGDNW